MTRIFETPLTRRNLLAGVAGGAALASAPAIATPAPLPPLRPSPAAPVRALCMDTPYFDFSGRTPPIRTTPHAPLDIETLTPAQRWLLGVC